MVDSQHAYGGGSALRASEAGDTARAEPPPSIRAHPGARSWKGGHRVNIRLSLPLVFGRYYVTIVAGKERRSAERRKAERRNHPLATFGNIIFLAAVGTVIGLACLVLLRWAALAALEQTGSLVRP